MRNDPIAQFDLWYKQRANYGLSEPDACVLSTSSNDSPNARIVLLKWYDDRGFVFFTNYRSAKAKELSHNSKCTLLFYWDKPGRQIKVTGIVHRTDPEESDVYFRSRPFLSRLASIASKQSQPMSWKYQIIFRMMKIFITTRDLSKRPDFWGGYTLVPDRIEFFEHNQYRINNRVVYEREDGELKKTYLYP